MTSTMPISSSIQGSTELRKAERVMARLRFVDQLRNLALPAATIGAAASAIAAPVIFPVAAGVAAAVLSIGELIVRRERKNLDEQLRALGAHDLEPSEMRELKTLESAANRLTVGGPSE